VIWLLLIDACLSIIADGKLHEVNLFFSLSYVKSYRNVFGKHLHAL
jgi:hypothetical protein